MESIKSDKVCEYCKSKLLLKYAGLQLRKVESFVLDLQRHFQSERNLCSQKCFLHRLNSSLFGVDDEDLLTRRVRNVQALLDGFERNSEQQTTSDCEWPEVTEALFEQAPCRGTFESCRYDEISDEQLKFLKRPSAENRISSAPSTKTSTVELTNSNSKNCMTSFLQPPRVNVFGKADSVASSSAKSASTSFGNDFRTAREELEIMNLKKYGKTKASTNSTTTMTTNAPSQISQNNNGAIKKTLGVGRRGVYSNFVSPAAPAAASAAIPTTTTTVRVEENSISDERLTNIDPVMIKKIENEIMHKYQPVDWSDIAGLDYAKSIIKETVVYPLLRPDIFTGLRRPPRGILLFGPPGTGKTLIGKCIASQSQSTFFSISAASLTSKYVGEGEKMVRTLFAVAAVRQPSVVFVDEIDSLLSQRSDEEHESSRRLKTEFLIQLDGAVTSNDDRVVIVGATNRPQQLDEAARRRLVRRLYIPLPELGARLQILQNLLQTLRNNLSAADIQEIAQLTEGFSGADMDTLCRDASLEPVRSIPIEQIASIDKDDLRPVGVQDFHTSLRQVRPSVSQSDLQQYTEWNSVYGSGR